MRSSRRDLPLVAALTILGTPGYASATEPPAPAPQTTAPPVAASPSAAPFYGYEDGIFFLRDRRGDLRLYPRALVALDAHGFFGKGADTLSASEAGVDLATSFFVRKARFGLGGELFHRIAFDAGVDVAARPAIDGAATGQPEHVVALDDAWAELDIGRGVRIMGGVFQAPFSLENRSSIGDLGLMERNVAIRGFAIPGGKALGVSAGGSLPHEILCWDVGVFGAESVIPGQFQRHFDGIGRAYMRPLGGRRTSGLRGLQIGVSARAGNRLPRDVSDDMPSINTAQGFPLLRPTHLDRRGRTIHVIPSGMQAAGGLELRIPAGGWDFRAEAYYVSRGTREAIDGHQADTTERLGMLRGVGWYAALSIWPLHARRGGSLPELGAYPHVKRGEPARAGEPLPRSRLEVTFLTGGINARYDASIRGGDPRSASAAPAPVATGIQIYQGGLALGYWHTRHVRFSLNGNLYYVPGSGTPDNLAVVPGNLGQAADPSAHLLGELGARTMVQF
ncbi:MAG: porin [Byssovorax sp.]